MSSFETERAAAIDAVARACSLCRTVQAELAESDAVDKKDRSPVTVADFGAQAVVAMHLARTLPDDPIVGEEASSQLRGDDGAPLRERVVRRVGEIEPGLDEETILAAIDRGDHAGGSSGRHWTVDPIDGTKGFLRGDQYAVALALIIDGEVTLGVLGCPNLPQDASDPESERGCLFVAVRGEGAFLRPIDVAEEAPIRVTEIDDPKDAAFCESVEAAHSSHSDSARVAELLGVEAEPFRIDSQCKYAAVARGNASIYLRLPTREDYQEKIWDHAAGQIVVTEAGGRVTDVDGKPLDFSKGRTLSENTGVIVTNGKLHDRTVAAVREVLGR